MRRIIFVLAIVLAGTGFSFASDNFDGIQPRVLYPNGGEILYAGSPVDIQWMSPSDLDEALVRILLSTDGGKNYNRVLHEFWSDDRKPVNMIWTWKDPGPISDQLKIKVSYVTKMPVILEDESDRTFSITSDEIKPVPGIQLKSPNGGEIFYRGNPVMIMWKTTDIAPETILIKLSSDGGSSYPILLAKLDGREKMPGWVWENKKCIGKALRISVEAFTKDGYYNDESDASFVIRESKIWKPYPKVFSNFPNPFNPVTTITFDLESAGTVNLTVYDLNGRTVETLIDGSLEAGTHSAVFDAAGLPSGIYLYRLISTEGVQTGRMQLIK